METQASIRFDHFACPVDDLVKAENFYTKTFEVPIFERRGSRVIDVRAGTSPRTFWNVAGSRVSLFRAADRCPKTRNCTALQRLASGSQATASSAFTGIAGKADGQVRRSSSTPLTLLTLTSRNRCSCRAESIFLPPPINPRAPGSAECRRETVRGSVAHAENPTDT